MEQGLHVAVVQLEDGQRDGPYTRANQLFFRVVEGEGRLEQGKRLKSIVEEKVYGLVVQAKDQSFQKVDEVVGELVILRELEIKRDQLREKGIAKQVEKVRLVFNVLDQN